MSLRSFSKRQVKRVLESLGLKVYSLRSHGREDWFDIRRAGARIDVIFDVGANVGQSARKFRSAFPRATIYCFEPVRSTFETLRAAAEGDAGIRCHRLALGSRPGRSTVYLTEHDTTSSLVRPADARGSEEVEVDTLDHFAAENGVERVDLLKVDAEGFDLEVLKGADGLLAANRVSFVLAEVGFHPGDDRHVLFDDVRDFLMKRGFSLYGIYDQTLEWSGEKRMRFANACFSNEQAFLR